MIETLAIAFFALTFALCAVGVIALLRVALRMMREDDREWESLTARRRKERERLYGIAHEHSESATCESATGAGDAHDGRTVREG